jgi:hypothetical protein
MPNYVRHSREGGNPAVSRLPYDINKYGWIPAFAGMTNILGRTFDDEHLMANIL